jgi:hypothetical protein
MHTLILALVSTISMLTRLSLAGGGSSFLYCGGSSNINVSAIGADTRCQHRFRYSPSPPRVDRRCPYSCERHCTAGHICPAKQRPFVIVVTRRPDLPLLIPCPGSNIHSPLDASSSEQFVTATAQFCIENDSLFDNTHIALHDLAEGAFSVLDICCQTP